MPIPLRPLDVVHCLLLVRVLFLFFYPAHLKKRILDYNLARSNLIGNAISEVISIQSTYMSLTNLRIIYEMIKLSRVIRSAHIFIYMKI